MTGNESNDCKSYILHMDREHRRLNQQLEHLRELFKHTHDVAGRLALSQQLQHFSGELAHHFNEEEDGGCVEEAVCRRPSLAHEVSIIEQQHRELKIQLAALIREVEQGKQTSAADFEKFTQAIDEHETLESHVLQKGFNTADEIDV